MFNHLVEQAAGLGLELSLDATSTSQHLARLRGLDEHLVFIVDEVDVPADQDLLVSLYEESNITILMVCSDEDDFLAPADNRVQSRVRTATKIRLNKYRDHELVDIIRGRVEAGLQHSAADDAIIRRIADPATISPRTVRVDKNQAGEHRLVVQLHDANFEAE